MQSKRAKFFLLLCLLVNGRLSAQQQASATLDTNVIKIGQQVLLKLDFKHDKNIPVEWPVLPDSLGSVEVVSRGKIDTILSGPTTLHRMQSIAISAYDSGNYIIPPIYFYRTSGDTVPIAASNPLLLTVQLVPVDTTKAFVDIKGVAELPFDWHDYINYIIGSVILLVLIILGIYIYYRIKKNKKVPLFFAPEPEIPAHEIALAALKELDNGKHWQNGQYKYYHATLSDIVRAYIERRWTVPAMEQTTDEILSNIVIRQLDATLIQKLNSVLKIADLAKFAKLQPLAHENEQSMKDAVEFVTATIPVAVVEEKEVKGV